jgi:hypothetical protein
MVSAFAAPVAHQDQDLSSGPCRVRDPENLRFRTVSNRFGHTSWLLTSPISDHGTGSKEPDISYVLAGTVSNRISWFSQPQVRFPVPAKFN